jgi:hypothetical protein
MSGKTAKTAVAALVIGLLGSLVWVPPSIHASEQEDVKKSIKIPGLQDKDALGHFPFQPFSVTVLRDGKITGILTLTLTVETKGGENMGKVMARRYELHDAFLRDIYGVTSFARADGRTIDPGVVKTRLMAISGRLLGEGVVENVLVVSIFNRNLS